MASSTLRPVMVAEALRPTPVAQAFNEGYRHVQTLASKSAVPTETLARISATSNSLPSAGTGELGDLPPHIQQACAIDSVLCALSTVSHANDHQRTRMANTPSRHSSEILPTYMHLTRVARVYHTSTPVGSVATTAAVTLRGLPAPATSVLANPLS
jgi:hypothetical protein